MATLYVPYYGQLRFKVSGVVAVGDGQFRDVPPDDGEVITYGGFLETLGGGAGTSTDVQIRNASKTPDEDLFSVLPVFEVDTATGELEGGELIASPKFNAGDIFWLDADAISTAPANMHVWLVCRFFREVRV